MRIKMLISGAILLSFIGSANAQNTENEKMCTTSTAQLKLFWTTVWENEVELPCDEIKALQDSKKFEAKVHTEIEVPDSACKNYVFGALQLCSDKAVVDSETINADTE